MNFFEPMAIRNKVVIKWYCPYSSNMKDLKAFFYSIPYLTNMSDALLGGKMCGNDERKEGWVGSFWGPGNGSSKPK